jgi:hypothetical protein
MQEAASILGALVPAGLTAEAAILEAEAAEISPDAMNAWTLV